jgi:hypothetical protein
MTDAERLLWSNIRGKQLNGHQFYRRKIIGSYIADFYCPKSRLVVEVDGGQHYSAEGKEKDRMRDDRKVSFRSFLLSFRPKGEIFAGSSLLFKPATTFNCSNSSPLFNVPKWRLKDSYSSFDNWIMKSAGKRSIFRLTCLFSCLTSTP